MSDERIDPKILLNYVQIKNKQRKDFLWKHIFEDFHIWKNLTQRFFYFENSFFVAILSYLCNLFSKLLLCT